MKVADFGLVPNAPALPNGVDPLAPKGVDQYILELIRHAALVESRINENLDAANRTNYFATKIDENGVFRGDVRLPVKVSNIIVN